MRKLRHIKMHVLPSINGNHLTSLIRLLHAVGKFFRYLKRNFSESIVQRSSDNKFIIIWGRLFIIRTLSHGTDGSAMSSAKQCYVNLQ